MAYGNGRGRIVDKEVNLGLRDIYNILRKRLWLIAAVTLTATMISIILNFFVIKPTYEASTSVIIGKLPTNEDSRMQYNDVMMYQSLVKTYVEIVNARTVSKNVVEKLGLAMKPEDLMKCISATPVTNTQMIKIKVSARSPLDAQRITNTVTEAFIIEAMKQFPSGTVKIMDPAVIPEHPSKPNKKLNVAIAFFLGLMISVGIVFLIEYMDNTIKTENDVEKYIGIPVIGVIPKNIDQSGRR